MGACAPVSGQTMSAEIAHEFGDAGGHVLVVVLLGAARQTQPSMSNQAIG